MEKAIFISDPADLRYLQDINFDRLYFGNEFCEHLLPNDAQIKEILNFVSRTEIKFTFVTCICSDRAIKKLENMLDIFPEKTEIVFNDWGLFGLINKNKKLTPVHGRLLCSIKKDPRIMLNSRHLDYFKSSNIQEEYQNMLVDYGILRVELDNVKQGYNLRLDKDIKLSLYYPFVQCSISRTCIFASDGISDKQENCFRNCLDKTITGKLTGRNFLQKGKKVYIKGNVQYYLNETGLTGITGSAIDRLVYMPKFPNQNSFSFEGGYSDWSYVYEKCDLSKLWGVTPNKIVRSMVNSIHIPDKGNILDVGCGTGRHYEIFEKYPVTYFGLDISSKAIEKAKRNIPKGIFYCENILEFNRYHNFFDIIIDYGCLHCLPPWQRKTYFEVIYNILKKEGYAVITVRYGEDSSLPNYYVLEQLPEWGFTKKEIMSHAENKFCVVEFKDEYAFPQRFIHVLVKKI